MTYALGLLFILVIIAIMWAVLIYNRLVASINLVRNAFSQIDVQLQRRYDLIPNLVETAKAYMAHERETLEAVIAARNEAAQAAKIAKDSPSAKSMQNLLGAENALGSVMGRFFALAESYPDLKADRTMAQLHEELASTENRIAFARQSYNDFAMRYNIRRAIFPNSLVASSFGFREEGLWKSDDGDAIRANVKVSF